MASANGRAAGRVCIVRQGYYPSDPRVRREAEALVELGYEVDLVCLREPGQARRETVGGVRVRRLPFTHRRESAARYLFEYTAFPLLAAAVVAALHLRRRFDVVQVNTMPDHLVFAAAVPKLLGARVVLDMHEAMPELYISKFGASPRAVRVITAVERASAAFADDVLTVSEPHRAVIAGHGVPAGKLRVVMNSADERLFRPMTNGHDPAAGPVLVTHGTLVARYGFQTAIRAMALLRDELPAARLMIIGDGEHAGALRELIAELGVEDRVELLGRRPLDEVPALLARADIGVVPNDLDDFTDIVVPTKLMEYVAMGLPAVVARSKAVEAYFDAASVAFFAPGDAEDLARAIVALAGDRAAARNMAERARSGFLAEHSWSVNKRAYAEIIGVASRS